MRRRVLVAVMVAGLVTASASPATAIDKPDWLPGNPLECPPGMPASKKPPMPTRPDTVGFPGDPNLSSVRDDLQPHDPNLDADPFAPDAKASILDQYGYAGLEWHTYDLGCGGDLANPAAALHTQIANWMMLVPITILQFLGFVSDAAWPDHLGRPDWMGVFDEPLAALGRAIAAGPVRVLLPLTTFVLGIIMVRKARKQSTADALTDAMWWFGLIVATMVLVVLPTRIAKETDHALGFGMGAVREAFGAGAGPLADIGPVHRDALYTAWLTGTFGSAESPAARQYGAELFKAQAFSWQELRGLDTPDKYRQAVQDKQNRWTEVAADVERDYPDAYYNLQGKSGGTRFMAAAGATLDVFVLSLFLLWAGLAFIVARFTIRTVILLAPLAAIIGVFPKHRHRVIGLWNMLVAALVRAVVALFAAGLVSILIGAVRSAPNTSQMTRTISAGVISYAAWRATKPLRKMGMLGAVKPVGSAGSKAWGAATNAAAAAFGAKVGASSVKGPIPTPNDASSRTGYHVGHARTRTGDTAGTGYRPTTAPPPLRSGMSVIDAVPTSHDGETVYRPKSRPTTAHRTVNHDDPYHGHARERSDPQPAGPNVSGGPLPPRYTPRPAPPASGSEQ